jgi:spermidine synthase
LEDERLLRFMVRALIASIAFYIAMHVVPDVTMTGGSILRRAVLVLLPVGVVNGLLPALLARPRRPVTPAAAALIAMLLNAALAIAFALARPVLQTGVRVDSFPGRPIDTVLAIGLVAIVAALPLLVEVVGLQVRPTFRPSTLSVRPSLDRRLVVLIFILSGASGLMYEVVWSRQLVLVFGNTTQAVSAILTGYFGGLAIGSIIGGRIADRVRSPLRMYGLLELALVVVVLITPLLFRGLHEVYRSWYGTLESQPTTLALIRYALALMALAPATVLMGATLPTLSRHLTRLASELGGSFGRLYAANTIGAVVGTVLAGIVLIELAGLNGTLLIGAIGSGAAGVAALALDRWRPRPAPVLKVTDAELGTPTPDVPTAVPAMPLLPTTTELETEGSTSHAIAANVRSLALVVSFVSGLTSLGYQVLWTRMLASGSGNRTYVFTLILATFLVGLSLGAAYVARRMAFETRSMARLGAAQLAVAAIVLAGMPILASDVAAGWSLAVRVFLVVLPATLVMGVTLPMAANLITLGEHRVGRDAGLVLGVNTLGAISGTFLIPFLAIPTIGSPRSVALLALVNAGLGVILLARQVDLSLSARRTAVTLGAVLTFVGAVGFAVPNDVVADPGANRMGRAGALFASKEDEIASVQAGSLKGSKRLFVGGTAMTSLTVDANLMALMPEFARPTASRMLVIAFGMGSSFRTGLRSGMQVDGVELVPSVPDMFGYFHADAFQVLANPRGSVIIADGRNYAELTDRRYDVVVVDPPPPIESSGTAVLYSKEFYRAVAARLTNDGVMMEWMPFGQTVDEFRAHVRTFASVYPNITLAFGPGHHGVFILGSTGSLALDPAAIASVLARPDVVADLDEAVDAPVSTREAWEALVPTLVWLSGPDVARFAGQGPLITDDQPLTEYYLLRRTFAPKSPAMTAASLRAASGH